jgi:hypothetical protein
MKKSNIDKNVEKPKLLITDIDTVKNNLAISSDLSSAKHKSPKTMYEH